MSGIDDSVGYEQARRLRATLASAGINQGRLWLYYFGLGGNISALEVDAYLHHLMTLPRLERDLLALAANEIVAEMTPPQAPYASEVNEASGNTDTSEMPRDSEINGKADGGVDRGSESDCPARENSSSAGESGSAGRRSTDDAPE